MYLIALCDDETAELEKTQKMLGSYEKKYPKMELQVKCFENADDLLDLVREEQYMPDLVLMDIYMPKKIGIKAAKELRDMGNTSRIIFLTMSKEYALDAFSVDAVQYLIKPISEDILFPLLDRFLKEAELERRKYVQLRMDGRLQRVALKDIVYCEAQGKMQCLHLADGTQLYVRMTMTQIYEMLFQYQEFVRVGIAYIMNLEYIDNLNSREICLNTKEKVYLPRGAYKTLKEQYFQYYCEEKME